MRRTVATMDKLGAVVTYLRMLLAGWDGMTDEERKDAVALALEAAQRDRDP